MILEKYNKNTCSLFKGQLTKKQISINMAHVRQVVLSTLLNLHDQNGHFLWFCKLHYTPLHSSKEHKKS